MSDNCSFGRLHHCIELPDLGFIFAEHLHRQAVESMECADITPQMPLFEIFIIGRVEDKPSQWLPLNTGFVTQSHKKDGRPLRGEGMITHRLFLFAFFVVLVAMGLAGEIFGLRVLICSKLDDSFAKKLVVVTATYVATSWVMAFLGAHLLRLHLTANW